MGIRAIILALTGLGGSIASLWRPYVGLLLLGVFYFFRPDVWSDYITPVKWLTVAILAGYVLVEARKTPVLEGAGWLIGLLALYTVATVLAPMTTSDSWDKLSMMGKIFLSVFLIDKLCRTPRQLAGFVVALIVGCLWFVKICIVTWLGSGFSDERVDAEAGQGGGSNYIAWSLVVLLPFIYYKAFCGRSWQRWAALALIGPWVMSIMATGSRGGLLCMAAATATFVLLVRRPGVALTFAAGAVLFLSLAPAGYLQRMATITLDPTKMDDSEYTRYENFQVAKRMVLDHPVFGTGLETFPIAKRPYLPPNSLSADKVAHDTYVQIATEVGLPALAAFVWVNLAAAWRLVRRMPMRDAQEDDDLNWMRVGLLSALAASWVQMTKADNAQADLLWWILGMSFTCHRIWLRSVTAQAAAGKGRTGQGRRPVRERLRFARGGQRRKAEVA